jgi:PHD/YefM family antitoxin component YafN of YafNO toxin-antitoxin module
MAITISSRDLKQDTDRAREAARNGPVFITDQGRAAHVLMTIEHYQRLSPKPAQTLADLLAMPGAEDIEFEPSPLQGPLSRTADLS